MWRKGNTFAPLVGMRIGVATVESSMVLPQKIKNGTALWPSDSASGNLSKETWNTNWKKYKQPYVHCSVIYNCQDLKEAQVSISRWVDKKAAVHLQNEILLGREKENFTICDNMGGPGQRYAKWDKIEKDKYHIISLICGIQWTNWTNKQSRDRLIDKRAGWQLGRQCSGGRRTEQKSERVHGHGQQCDDCGWR